MDKIKQIWRPGVSKQGDNPMPFPTWINSLFLSLLHIFFIFVGLLIVKTEGKKLVPLILENKNRRFLGNTSKKLQISLNRLKLRGNT